MPLQGVGLAVAWQQSRGRHRMKFFSIPEGWCYSVTLYGAVLLFDMRVCVLPGRRDVADVSGADVRVKTVRVPGARPAAPGAVLLTTPLMHNCTFLFPLPFYRCSCPATAHGMGRLHLCMLMGTQCARDKVWHGWWWSGWWFLSTLSCYSVRGVWDYS